jgi:hypothetical protein
MPPRNPAISTATYPPPTTNVFPGGYSLAKISSLVIASSLPWISRYCGLVPVAITKFLALIFWYLFVYVGSYCVVIKCLMIVGSSEHSNVFLSIKLAIALRYTIR